MWLLWLLVWVFGSVAVAGVAGRWNRNAAGYLLASLFLSPLVAGLVLVAEGENTKRCYHCGSKMSVAAFVCPYCRQSPAPPMMQASSAPQWVPLPESASKAHMTAAHVILMGAACLATVIIALFVVAHFTTDTDPQPAPKKAPTSRRR